MITASRKPDGSLEISNGYMRLKAQLQLNGTAQVVDTGTGKTIYVHEVDGRMLALSEDSQANIEDLANAVINHARGSGTL